MRESILGYDEKEFISLYIYTYIYILVSVHFPLILKFSVSYFFTARPISPFLTAINFLEDCSVIYRNTGNVHKIYVALPTFFFLFTYIE